MSNRLSFFYTQEEKEWFYSKILHIYLIFEIFVNNFNRQKNFSVILQRRRILQFFSYFIILKMLRCK